MKKTKEYKEFYVSVDEYYIMDDDIDDNLEKPFINNQDEQIDEFNKITQITQITQKEKGCNTDNNKITLDKSTNTEYLPNLVDSLNLNFNYNNCCKNICKCVIS